MNNYYRKEYYGILEVSVTATEAEIKAAFRKLARRYHPDVNQDKVCIDKFKQIKEAYEVLINPDQRKIYNTIKGYSDKRTTYTQGNKPNSERKYAPPPNVNKEEPKEQKQQAEKNDGFSNVFDDFIEGMFTSKPQDKKTQKYKPAPQNGQDITMRITVSYIESINGTNRKINILHTEKCSNCQGKKFINGAICKVCGGKGEVSIHKKLNVKIPAGIIQHSKIRIVNEGNKGSNGGKSGDLYLIVEIENDSLFKFEGNNVVCEIPITPYEAALGTSIDVPTLEGKVTMKIPPLTSSGQKFRLTQEGILDRKTGLKGDQVVVIKIEMPKGLSLEEIQLYERLKAVSNETPRKNLRNAKQ